MRELPFDQIANRYDLLNDLLSCGLHRRWKRELVRRLLTLHGDEPNRVLDVASGTGDIARLFSDKLAGNRVEVIGIDPSPRMLELSKKKQKASSKFIEGRSEELPIETSSIDILSCAFGVRNFEDRTLAFSEWKRVLKPDGIVGILEIHPIKSSLLHRPASVYWKRFVPWLGKLFGFPKAYSYLKDSALNFLSAGELSNELEGAGFKRLFTKTFFPCPMVSLSLFQKE